MSKLFFGGVDQVEKFPKLMFFFYIFCSERCSKRQRTVLHADGSKEAVQSEEDRRANRRRNILQKIQDSNLELFSPDRAPTATAPTAAQLEASEVEITDVTGAKLPMFYPPNLGEIIYAGPFLGINMKMGNLRILRNRRNQIQRDGCQFPPGKPTKVLKTGGDGNCLFRALSLIFSGSEEHYVIIRKMICQFIKKPANHDIFKGHLGTYQSGAAYIKAKRMETDGTWATDVEIIAAAALSRLDIAVYTERNQFGSRAGAWEWFRSSGTPNKTTPNAVYISNVDYHFQPVYDA